MIFNVAMLDAFKTDQHFSDAVEMELLKFIALNNQNDFCQAMTEKKVITLINEKAKEIDDRQFAHIPWQAVLCIKTKWLRLRDDDVGMQAIYQNWNEASAADRLITH